MTTLLDGRATAAQIRSEIATSVQEMVEGGHRRPGLAAVLVGDDPASEVYVRSKAKGCEEAGMIGRTVRLTAAVTQLELERTLDQLNADDAVDGILLQLPIPGHLDSRALLDRIDPSKDVDGFHPMNVGRLWLGEPALRSATPAGIMELLRRYEIELMGRHAVIVGRSAIVGKPMAALLLAEHCTVTICHSRTRDLAGITSQADLLVAAVGRPAVLGPDHVRAGAVVIDVGTNRITDRAEVERLFPGNPARLDTWERRGAVLVGDVDYTQVAPKATAITPVPGGVGPLTVAMVLANTLVAARQRQGLT